MSPSWRERFCIGLAPERVAVLRFARGLRPRLAADRVRECGEAAGPAWTAALAALDALLDDLSASGGLASVALSNQFVRYAEVPWTQGVLSDRDRDALAADCFRAVYGEAVDGWQFVLAAPQFGRASLAAAVDKELVESLRAMLAGRRMRLASLRPHLAIAFDRSRRHLLPADDGFAVIEPGGVTALFRRGDDWTAVANRRLRGSGEAAASLGQCLDFDRLQGGSGAVAVLAPAGALDVKVINGRPLRPLGGLAGPWPEDPWRALAWSAA